MLNGEGDFGNARARREARGNRGLSRAPGQDRGGGRVGHAAASRNWGCRSANARTSTRSLPWRRLTASRADLIENTLGALRNLAQGGFRRAAAERPDISGVGKRRRQG